jgi:hypothetical protein
VIVVQLTGGLGNQMFQYATARALATRRRTELVLDSSWIDGSGGSVTGEPRRYELGCFELDAPLVPVERVARLPRSRSARLRRLLPRGRRPVLHEFVEPPFGRPLPALLDAPDDTYLRGYWQNTAYFEDAEPLLRRDFTFRPGIVERGAEVAGAIRSSPRPTVSVHVRRSDYVADPGVRERMGPLEPDYYRRALEAVTSGAGRATPFVFTDDPEWCESHLELAPSARVLGATRAEGETWASFMHLMTLCDHHVLANSSFGWWGAWLDAGTAKIVVAPEPWLQDPRWDNSRRLPESWIRVPRRAEALV